MARALSGLALLIFFIACGEKLPEGVAPARVMPSLLFDIHLLDSRLSTIPIDSSRILREPAYDAVFKRFGLDSTSFRETMAYYARRPGQLSGFYAKVQERLQKKLDEEQARIEEEVLLRYRADSLASVRMRDSLYWLNRAQVRWDEMRYWLIRKAGDTTDVERSPFTFEDYSTRFMEDVAAWKLHFWDSLQQEPPRMDSLLRDSLLRDSLRLDSLRLDSLK